MPVTATAHGAIDQQIEAVTKAIERDPGDASLYLKRAELHRVHRSWQAALADYGQASRVDPGDASVSFYRGRMLLEAGRPDSAKAELDRFLLRQPGHGEALATRARALLQLGERPAAARDFSLALAHLDAPNPSIYLDRARALADEGQVAAALRGLDDGIERLGAPITLELAAIQLELDAKRYDPALARLDRVAARAQRKELWLTRRAEILQQAGRASDARQAYAAALEAIETLSARKRRARATAQLETRLRAALDQAAPPAVEEPRSRR
jgi:tetratricopeptide (TPR) repeat protein